jgi:HPt (histidine-containing phosphotransfer) domain-containing protein
VTEPHLQPDSTQDRQTLDQLRLLERENPGLIKELIRLFVADAPKQMRLIDSAYRQRDPEALRQSAHFLRSGALALGLVWLAERARAFEQLPYERYGDPLADASVKELRTGLHQILLVLLQNLKGL